MKNVLTALLSLALLGCNCETRLVKSFDPRCNTKCYMGEQASAGIGICSFGEWECDEDGDVVSCVGSVPPSKRECNGLDNDCDGLPDSLFVACSSECGSGTAFCASGVMEECNAPRPTTEICNRFDDDCDGTIDNVPVSFCYTGPVGTVMNGDCRPGTTRCVSGRPACIGEKLPSYESCDGVDNDCDGEIDEEFSPPQDIVFIIDYSCSMTDKIVKLTDSIDSWSRSCLSPTCRIALVKAPGPNSDDEQIVKLVDDFTDASSIIASMRSLLIDASPSMTGLEPTLDAIMDVADFVTNRLRLSWCSGANRTIVMLADEHAQSYNYTPALTTQSVASFVKNDSPKITVNVFTDPTAWQTYEPIVSASGGSILNIYMNEQDMTQEMNTMMKKMSCGN